MDPSTTLSLTVTLAVIAAAVTHAAWNAIAHGIKDQTLAFALIGVGGIAVGIPLVILAAMPRADCWPYLLGSVAIHVREMARALGKLPQENRKWNVDYSKPMSAYEYYKHEGK